MRDNEPTLNGIEDYDTLKGSKKKTVWLVIVSGLLIGLLLLAVKIYSGNADDALPVQETIGKVPVK